MSKRKKVLAVIGGLVCYLIIGGAVAWGLHDKINVAFIAVLNYLVAMAVFGPILPFVFDNQPEKTK